MMSSLLLLLLHFSCFYIVTHMFECHKMGENLLKSPVSLKNPEMPYSMTFLTFLEFQTHSDMIPVFLAPLWTWFSSSLSTSLSAPEQGPAIFFQFITLFHIQSVVCSDSYIHQLPVSSISYSPIRVTWMEMVSLDINIRRADLQFLLQLW